MNCYLSCLPARLPCAANRLTLATDTQLGHVGHITSSPFTLYSTPYWSGMLYTATATLISCNLRQSPSTPYSIWLYHTLWACSQPACGFPCHYQSVAVYLTVHAVTRTVLLMFHKILDGNDETLRFAFKIFEP